MAGADYHTPGRHVFDRSCPGTNGTGSMVDIVHTSWRSTTNRAPLHIACRRHSGGTPRVAPNPAQAPRQMTFLKGRTVDRHHDNLAST